MRIFFCLFIISFCPIYTMDNNSIWINTTDGYTIKCNEKIIQESLTLQKVRKKYRCTQEQPIQITLSTDLFRLLHDNIQYPPTKIINTLSHKDYLQLIECAEIFKCSNFCDALMIALYPNNNILKTLTNLSTNNSISIEKNITSFLTQQTIKQ